MTMIGYYVLNQFTHTQTHTHTDNMHR